MSDWIEKMHALADGELTGAEKAEATQALASDSRMAAEHEWAKLFKNQLREKLPPIHDQETWQACRARLGAIDKASRAEVFVGKYAWAFCLIFLVGIFSAATMNRTGGSRPLTNDHVAGLFNGLTPFSFTESSDAVNSVRDRVGLAPHQLSDVARVVAVAAGAVDGRRAGRITLDDGRGFISLFVISGTTKIEGLNLMDAGYVCGSINDSQAVGWTDSGYLCLLVGPRNSEELKRLADAIRVGR